MHADRPGDRPRLLYWYRTAPGIILGRPALDEDAIRTIEEQHPDIDFDWPAILALSEVMTPEEEAPPRQQSASARNKKKRELRPASAGLPSDQLRRDARAEESSGAVAVPSEPLPAEGNDQQEADDDRDDDEMPAPHHHVSGLLEELVGREIATRLRARYSEIQARIHEQQADIALRDQWLKRAAAINPDLWLTPDAILEGVRNADAEFAQLHAEIHSSGE